jgi:hypothetical protein
MKSVGSYAAILNIGTFLVKAANRVQDSSL